ncbi:hypothetical protein OF83DRAFT_1084533 [Amylostereum chailletii]|nr:hypothetical protein OF83DRAFT_1084533 [Amylostereum chailletii]
METVPLVAGLIPSSIPVTPAAFASHFGKSQYDWGYATVPQKGSSDRAVYWARGKGLGGSSGINFFQYHLPAKSDVDAFEKLGNVGWNWDLFKKYHTKSEKFEKPAKVEETMSLDLNEHGTQGPYRLESIYHETLHNMGIQRAAEPFSGDTKGTWLTPVTIHPAQRVRTYAANMYLKPVLSRDNLTVLVSSHVSGISTTTVSDGVKATSVMFVNEGKSYEAFVQREVIVAAGAIGSPQVLELSGIGSDTVLKKVGVDVKVNLPGETIADLQSFVELIKFNRRVVELEPMKGKELNPGSECQTDAEIAEWLAKNHNTTYHTVGSCSMLPREDGGVVDTRLKVYGTSNIRVVDVSVLPVHIGAHLQAADIIKGNIFKA